MRVMVSLNLADIMTATHPTTPQRVNETPNNEVEPVDPSHESMRAEQTKNTTESIE